MANFPSRPATALSGSAFMQMLESKDFGSRDDLIVREIIKGNFPDFMRKLAPITVKAGDNTLVYYVTPDYLCVGDNQDYVRVPLGGSAAQQVADAFGCILPTSKISDQIWQQAKVKLPPKPMSGITSTINGQTYSPQQFLAKKMTDTDSFIEHNRLIQEQMSGVTPGELVAGGKKDVIITNQLATNKDRVAIHGLHDTNGKPIQGKSSVHSLNYRDYSHGVRLVDKVATLNGKKVDLVSDILQKPEFSSLVSNEGAIQAISYNYKNKPTNDNTMMASNTNKSNTPKKNNSDFIISKINEFLDQIKI